MADPFFSIRNVTKRFGGLVAVDGVGFDIRQNEVLCVIGPNGSGKTTLFNIISGLLKPEAGSIRFKGTELVGLAPHKIAELGVGRSFQQARMFPNMTLLQNAEIPQFTGSKTTFLDALLCLPSEREERRRIRERSEQLFAEVGGGQLYDRRNDYPNTCSLGEQRLIEMIRILAADPEFIMLDEPTQGLNPVWIKETLGLIDEIKKRNKTILFIEHKMSVVMQISDRVVVLNNGQKIAEGTPQEVRQNPLVIQAYLGD